MGLAKKLRDKEELKKEKVKGFLKIDHDHEDFYIELLINAATQRAESYINRDWEDEEDIPADITIGCLKAIASWYETRTDDQQSQQAGYSNKQMGETPWAAQKLWALYRLEPGL